MGTIYTMGFVKTHTCRMGTVFTGSGTVCEKLTHSILYLC
jgi:hypothetical protein